MELSVIRGSETVVEEKKIRIMTALAIYDKYQGKKDKKIDSYFKGDYIYKKNWMTRVFVVLGFLVLAGLYTLNLIFVQEIDYTAIDLISKGKKSAFLLGIVLILYTTLGMYTNGKEYDKAQKRLKSYYSLLSRLISLDKCNENEKYSRKGN